MRKQPNDTVSDPDSQPRTRRARGVRSRKKEYSAPALEKGLDILELLSGEAEGLNTTEIARRLDRSVGELFRMLVVLEQRGYLVNEPGTDRFRLTLKLFELAHRFAPIRRLTTAAEPIMSQLSDSIEQSCHLVVYYEGRGRVVAQQDSPSLRSFSVRLGADAPLVNTCSGHLLLAFAHPATRRTMLERIPKHHPQPGKRELESVYRRVVENGYERLVSDQVFGVEDVGYPVFNHAGKVTAALVVPFLSYLDDSHSVKIDAAREFIHEAALELSADLGHSSSQAALGALSSR